MFVILLRKYCACAMALVLGSVTLAQAQNTTTRVSVATGGAQATGGSSIASRWPEVSANGRYVVFQSFATNLVPGDTNNTEDVFLHDRQTGVTELVSVGPAGVLGNGNSVFPRVSADGRFVSFYSIATNLVAGDTNGTTDVFVRDRQAGATTRVSVGTGNVQGDQGSGVADLSADGRWVVYYSSATNLVSSDTNAQPDIFLHDRDTGTTTRVSVSSAGAQAGGGLSFNPVISADGRFVAFESASPQLVAGDTNGVTDVFVRDIQAGTTTRVSVTTAGEQGTGNSTNPDISSDGRFISMRSANLTGAGGQGIYLHDRQTGTTSAVREVPATTDPAEVPEGARISGDGRYVVYEESVLAVLRDQLWIVDRLTGTRTRLDVNSSGTEGNDSGTNPAINQDGTVMALRSLATNLVAGDTNGLADIFVRHLPGNSGPPLPSLTLDKTSLKFGALTNGASLLSQTGAQIVRLTQSGSGTVTWTATSNQSWLQVSPASGSGSANLSITVAMAGGLPTSGTVNGAITLALTGASGPAGPIAVSLSLVPNGTSANPFGNVDTPSNNQTGVTGAIPFTGWALDDIEVTRVSVCRAAFGSEVAPVDPNCGGVAQIFVGFAVFIDGARPDVAGSYPAYPANTKAGWGFMVLTNMLPSQGNGTYQFFMWAQDREGHAFLLGSRTMSCANAAATKPFGAIDTPEQGGVATGGAYVNFGWTLTPLPKTIPPDGSTIAVLVDGVPVGTADYNHARPDIAGLFPGLNNTNGAIGFRVLDTTALTNGTHTIVWVVSDNQGAAEGIGSRFFTVSNGAGALTAASALTQMVERGTSVSRPASGPLFGRRGWDLHAPLRAFEPDETGRVLVRSEEVNRVELHLGSGFDAGYLKTNDGLQSLPIGSQIDDAGVFTWAPGVGFVGVYDLTFVRANDASRRDVRIILAPKGSGRVGPQVVIDTPRSQQDVGQPFLVGGWAADLNAAQGTGIATLHAWAYPLTGGPPVFLGATAYGGARPDVATAHGEEFQASGFALQVQGLVPGHYDLALFAWSTEQADFVNARTVRVSVRP